MKIVDLNILLYAVNSDASHHDRIVEWWEEALNGDEIIGLPWAVVVGFLRISTSTNPHILPNPLSPEQAIDQIDAWLALDVVSLVTETGDQWPTLRGLLTDAGVAGNLATDAHLAALAATHGATLASCDGDFARFEQLRWENPLRRES